jgi:outer membrane lipoprotein-sorting protein
MKKLLLIPMILLVSGAALWAQTTNEKLTVDDILTRYFEVIGGADKWKALQSMNASGNLTTQGFDLPFTSHAKRPNKMRMLIQVQGMEIIQAYDGVDAWALNPMMGGKDPVKMPVEDSKDFRDQKFESEYIDYKKKGHALTLLGTEEIEGVKCFKLELIKNKHNDEEDVTEIHYFDSENYVPIMVLAYARSGQMKGAEIKSYLSDYQEVNGLMMPFSLEIKYNGQTVQKLSYQKVTFNETIDDSIFAFPKN